MKMKRITLTGAVVLNVRSRGGVERFVFEPKQAYEVSDAVANHAYLKQFILTAEDIPEAVKKTAGRKRKAAADGNADS